jgi:hypothetical protein
MKVYKVSLNFGTKHIFEIEVEANDDDEAVTTAVAAIVDIKDDVFEWASAEEK